MMNSPRNSHSISLHLGSDLTERAVTHLLCSAGFAVESNSSALANVPSLHLMIVDDFAPDIAPTSTSPRIIRISNCIAPCTVHAALARGTKGYLYLGDSLTDRLPQAVKDVLAGGVYLSPSASTALEEYRYFQSYLTKITPYHRQVLDHMLEYRTAGQIAALLGRTTQAIYQVQRYLREQFEANSNGALLERLTALGVLQRRPYQPAILSTV
jgi:hypothetical protein